MTETSLVGRGLVIFGRSFGIQLYGYLEILNQRAQQRAVRPGELFPSREQPGSDDPSWRGPLELCWASLTITRHNSFYDRQLNAEMPSMQVLTTQCRPKTRDFVAARSAYPTDPAEHEKAARDWCARSSASQPHASS